MNRVAIIGGGISGLTAAWALSRAAAPPEVLLLESSNRLGGVLETLQHGDYLIERSADNFATLIPDALELSQDCGFESELISPEAENRQAFVLNRGRLLPIPAGFSLMQPTRLGPVITTQALSWSGKLRLLSELWVARRKDEADESLESFATRRLGREAYENLVEPIVSGIFTADPSTLSMQATMPQFVEMERRNGGLIRGYLAARRKDAAATARRASGARYDQFLAPRHGMSSWVAHIVSQLPSIDVRLNTPVPSIRRDPTKNGWCIETARESYDVDAIVLATPAAVTSELLKNCLPEASKIVGAIPYASSAVVAMVVKRSEIQGRIDGFGLIVPRKEGMATLAISYSSNKYPGRVPADEVLLRIFLGGALNAALVEEPDDVLIQLAQRECRSILGWQGSPPAFQQVIRWRNAMPQYLIGHVQRMQQLQNLLATVPTLKLCGAAYSGVGIPQCVRSARRAVRELLGHWGRETHSPRPGTPGRGDGGEGTGERGSS